MTEEIKSFLDFYKKVEKLKTTTRHSWLSDSSRQESVAEHSWMLGLLAIILSERLETKVDLLRVLKMVIIHDLAEAVTGDIPSHEISDRQKNKPIEERKAMRHLVSGLSKNLTDEIISTWEEFEDKKTTEAKFAQALDKIETIIQHNVADISTWDQNDYNICLYYKDHLFNFDSFLRKFKDIVNDETVEKVIDAKQESRIDQKNFERYKNKHL